MRCTQKIFIALAKNETSTSKCDWLWRNWFCELFSFLNEFGWMSTISNNDLPTRRYKFGFRSNRLHLHSDTYQSFIIAFVSKQTQQNFTIWLQLRVFILYKFLFVWYASKSSVCCHCLFVFNCLEFSPLLFSRLHFSTILLVSLYKVVFIFYTYFVAVICVVHVI